jgi:Right handed beta helix region
MVNLESGAPGSVRPKLRSLEAQSCVLLCFILTAIVLQPLAHASSYYIDNSTGMCSDSGPHTQDQPWCDFTTFNVTTFQPGDTIYLKAGDTWNQAITLNGSGSKAGGVITLTSYGTGNKPKLAYSPNAWGGVIFGWNISYWTISGLEVEDTSTTLFDPANQAGITSAIEIDYDGPEIYSNITISNNVLYGVGTSQNNIVLEFSADYPSRTSLVAQNISITNNTIYNGGRCLVCFFGSINGKNMTYLRGGGYSNVNFTGNTVYNSALQGVILTAAINSVARDNVVHDTGLYVGPGETWGPVALWSVGGSHITFENNEVYNSFDGSTGYDSSGIDVDWDNSYATVQSNYLHDNKGAGVEVLSSDHTSVLYNRLYNNAGKTNVPAQISLNDFSAGSLHGITNALVAHNVVILSSPQAIALSTFGTAGYAWSGNNYSHNYVLFADSNAAYDLKIDGIGDMTAVNQNTFYSASGGFEASIDGATMTSLANWRANTGFDAASSEAMGITSVSQQRSDFTPAGHTSNQWSYLYSEDGESSFRKMSWNQSAQVWEGPELNCAIGAGFEQPGRSCDAVLTWTAIAGGTAVIAADSPISVQAGCGGSGVNIRILKNTNQIWPRSGWKSLANGDSFTFRAFSTPVNPRDELRFVIQHAGTNNNCDVTYWNPIVINTSPWSWMAPLGFF